MTVTTPFPFVETSFSLNSLNSVLFNPFCTALRLFCSTVPLSRALFLSCPRSLTLFLCFLSPLLYSHVISRSSPSQALRLFFRDSSRLSWRKTSSRVVLHPHISTETSFLIRFKSILSRRNFTPRSLSLLHSRSQLNTRKPENFIAI